MSILIHVSANDVYKHKIGQKFCVVNFHGSKNSETTYVPRKFLVVFGTIQTSNLDILHSMCGQKYVL